MAFRTYSSELARAPQSRRTPLELYAAKGILKSSLGRGGRFGSATASPRPIPGGGIDAHCSSTVRRRGQGSETTPLGTQAAFFVTGFGPETEESDDCDTQNDSRRDNRDSSEADAGRRSVRRPARGRSGDKSMRQAIESGQVGFQALGELLPPLVRTAGLLVLACFRALPPNRPFRRRPPGPTDGVHLTHVSRTAIQHPV